MIGFFFSLFFATVVILLNSSAALAWDEKPQNALTKWRRSARRIRAELAYTRSVTDVQRW